MEIKLETNKSYTYKFLIPIISVLSVIILGLSIFLIVKFALEFLVILIILILLDSIFIYGIFSVGYKQEVIFNENTIEIKNNKGKEVLKVSDIISLTYKKVQFWHYLLALFFVIFGEDIFCFPTLIAVLENGNKINLGYVNQKDIERLKEIYKDLIVVD